MEILKTWGAVFREDVNKEDSEIIRYFGQITNFLFKMLMLLGVPYMIYLFSVVIK
ncbi:hypothetical protein [Bacillus sp. T33-2]|uniref:hypothetical protein n=1 Tax=Bacillus sp. T33-2 TaxID=2054168 RepID=UPI0015E0FC98|nr:hypothetical protein [Bacillus sp. T33-2]